MVVGAYFTNWSVYARQYEPADLPLNALTHVFYAFGRPDPQSKQVVLSDEYADRQKVLRSGSFGCLNELRELKKRFSFRVLLSVGGASYANDFGFFVRNQHLHAKFVVSLVNLVETYAFDGVDLDWEYPSTPADQENFTSLVKLLRKSLNNEREISVTIPGGTYNLRYFDLLNLDPLVSFWNVMAYDYAGSWSPVAQHAAALRNEKNDSVTKTVDNLLIWLNSEKIVLGIPLYGRSFAGATNVDQPFGGGVPGSLEMGVHDVKDLPLNGYVEYTDRQAGAAIATDNHNFVSFDNEKVVEMKALYCAERQLGGAFFWEASMDREPSLIRKFADHWR